MEIQPKEIQPKVKNKLSTGSGRITVSLHGEKAVLSELSSTYPLKLLSPHIYDGTAIVYLLTYGGGLVGGDEIDLVVDVQLGARLLLLSQVSL
jgi:urease accessory protein